MQHAKTVLIMATLIVLATITGCKNNTKQEVTADSLPPLIEENSQATNEVQHNFPEQPVNIVKDTTVVIDKKKYSIKTTQKTIDTSMVVFVHQAQGKVIKDVYLDFEYTIKPNAAEYTGDEKLITKHTFTKDFNEDFINNAVLYDMQFLGFNDLSKEYELKFIITKPDTDFSYVIYYFINLKGEVVYEINDL